MPSIRHLQSQSLSVDRGLPLRVIVRGTCNLCFERRYKNFLNIKKMATFIVDCIVDNMNISSKVDGILLLGSSLEFLNPNTKIAVKFPLFVEYVEKREMKGCRTVAEAQGIW